MCNIGKTISIIGNTKIGTRISSHRIIGINLSVIMRTGGDILLASS